MNSRLKLMSIMASVFLIFSLFINYQYAKQTMARAEIPRHTASTINANVLTSKKETTTTTEDTKEVTQNIEIESTKETQQQEALLGSSVFGYNDALVLHKISVAEAGNVSVESMALVMLVVLNRVESNKFPDSIEEVVFQKTKKGVAQFSPTVSGGYDRAKPNEKSRQAMELVLSGWDESQEALYFESCKGETWHSRNLRLLFEKDGVRYYKEKG